MYATVFMWGLMFGLSYVTGEVVVEKIAKVVNKGGK